jgi:hypothetical protein
MMADPAPPAAKRAIRSGCSGKDVMAVQRALYVALDELGAKGTNAKNGTFGKKTAADIVKYQRLAKIKPTGKVGQLTLQALWNRPKKFPSGGFDPYGVSMLYRAKIGKPTKVGTNLKYGKKGPEVGALQRMLWRALGGDAQNKRNNVFGKGTQRDLALFLRRADWKDKPTNRVGQEVWAALWGFGDDRAKMLARKAAVSPDDAIRQRIRSWGEWYVQNRSRITYAQIRPYPKTANLPARTDCSGSSTHILFMSKCPNDPHGRGWDGQGYTGTMYQRGTRIPVSGPLKPGDCLFYGNQGGGVPSHVAIVIGPGDRMMTFGHNPPEFVYASSYWRSNLRTDVGARRYF